MSSYSDLLNETSYEGDNLTTNTLLVNTSTVLGYLSNSIIGVNASGVGTSMPLLNGQLLIGRTGQTPTRSSSDRHYQPGQRCIKRCDHILIATGHSYRCPAAVRQPDAAPLCDCHHASGRTG